jgi:peroxiredoxin (alkyl hydroperoxide reductase subunit C)
VGAALQPPADFTPVCSTELVEFARRSGVRRAQHKLIGLSIDSIHNHLAWRENLRESSTRDRLPDPGRPRHAGREPLRHAARRLGTAVRAVFVIDPKRVVRALVYRRTSGATSTS